MVDLATRRSDELVRATALFREAGIGAPRREAVLLWSEVTGIAPGDVVLRPEASVEAHHVRRFRQAVARRAAGEPLAYVTGTAGFRRLTLGIDRRALIPRPETEGLVELVLRLAPEGRALDLGTGSGCVALALADEGRYREVVAVDRSPAALALARENAARTGLTVRWLEGDWTEPVTGELFDVVVTNPPYIPDAAMPGLDPSVRDWEPHGALDGGPDGLAEVARLLRQVPDVTAPGGWLGMELDAGHAVRAAGLAVEAGWREVSIGNDLFGRPRYLTGRRESRDAG